MNKTLQKKIEEIIKGAYYQGTAEGSEYSCGVDEAYIKAMVTLFKGEIKDAVEAERARLESLIPEKRKMEDCHCLYSEGCGCGVRDFSHLCVVGCFTFAEYRNTLRLSHWLAFSKRHTTRYLFIPHPLILKHLWITHHQSRSKGLTPKQDYRSIRFNHSF